jgi:hypothetical protein
MIVGLPSGIGDISWAYSKLCNAGPLDYHIADGWPYRSREYMSFLPMVKSVEYSPDFSYQDIIHFESIHGWLDRGVTWASIAKNGYGRVLIEPNQHLECGRPLSGWLPDLPVDYHYEVNIPIEYDVKAANLLEPYPRPIVAISCASYRGSEAWKTWGSDKWDDFLSRLKSEMSGGTILLVGGFWDDLTASLESEGYPCLVGKTHIGTMLSILKNVELYLGFSSGLGVMRTVFKKNAFMLWPDHQIELSTSWAPPHMIEDGSYVASLWRDPVDVWRLAKGWLKRNAI